MKMKKLEHGIHHTSIGMSAQNKKRNKGNEDLRIRTRRTNQHIQLDRYTIKIIISFVRREMEYKHTHVHIQSHHRRARVNGFQ